MLPTSHPSPCSAAPRGVSVEFTSLAYRRPAALCGCANELALEHKRPEHFLLRASNFWGRAGIYVAAGYMGSVSVVTTVKWFWFLIGLVALFGVLVHFAQTFKAYADAKGGAISSLYGKLAWLSILAWICYPVVWLFSEGFASFSVSFEVCAYAILDMITKVVVSFMVMSGALFLARQQFGLRLALALCAASCVGTEKCCCVLSLRDEQPTTCWVVWADASPTTPKAMYDVLDELARHPY